MKQNNMNSNVQTQSIQDTRKKYSQSDPFFDIVMCRLQFCKITFYYGVAISIAKLNKKRKEKSV